MKFFNFGGPSEGEIRELSTPQELPADQWLESAATHEVYQNGEWRPAVVETLGAENARYVVPATRCYSEDGDGEDW